MEVFASNQSELWIIAYAIYYNISLFKRAFLSLGPITSNIVSLHLSRGRTEPHRVVLQVMIDVSAVEER